MIKASIGKDRYQTTLSNSRHRLIADEPASENGSDLGPTPDELLMMSLASCTAITLRMYCDRKEWPVTGIDVEVDMVRSDSGTQFSRNVLIKGELDATQSERLRAIANACPVHKTLTRPISIETIVSLS
jgi:putative redox protein